MENEKYNNHDDGEILPTDPVENVTENNFGIGVVKINDNGNGNGSDNFDENLQGASSAKLKDSTTTTRSTFSFGEVNRCSGSEAKDEADGGIHHYPFAENVIADNENTNGSNNNDSGGARSNTNINGNGNMESSMVSNSVTSNGSSGQIQMDFMPERVLNTTYSIQSVDSLNCRICQSDEQIESFISPCLCKGSLAYVHTSCLERWLNTSGTENCELCYFRFSTEQTLRYTCLQSIRLWYRYSNNRGLLKADFLLCFLLTFLTVGLFGITILAHQYFIFEGDQMEPSRTWTLGVIIVFLVIVVFAYAMNVILIVKSQLEPWYRWWQRSRKITIISLNSQEKQTTYSNLSFDLI